VLAAILRIHRRPMGDGHGHEKASIDLGPYNARRTLTATQQATTRIFWTILPTGIQSRSWREEPEGPSRRLTVARLGTRLTESDCGVGSWRGSYCWPPPPTTTMTINYVLWGKRARLRKLMVTERADDGMRMIVMIASVSRDWSRSCLRYPDGCDVRR